MKEKKTILQAHGILLGFLWMLYRHFPGHKTNLIKLMNNTDYWANWRSIDKHNLRKNMNYSNPKPLASQSLLFFRAHFQSTLVCLLSGTFWRAKWSIPSNNGIRKTVRQKMFGIHEKFFCRYSIWNYLNKPGTAQVGAISKAQKQQKDFKVSKYLFSSTVPEKPKSWTELAHQREHFEIFHPFCGKSLKKIGGALLVNKKFLKKSVTMPKKTERGTLWDFSTSVLSENSKKLKGGPFGEKIAQWKSAD